MAHRPKLTRSGESSDASEYAASRDWRGQGIAKAMYIAAGLWTQSWGFNLRAGSINHLAQPVWEALTREGIVENREVITTNADDKYAMTHHLVIPPDWTPSCSSDTTSMFSK